MTKEYAGDCNPIEAGVGASGDTSCRDADEPAVPGDGCGDGSLTPASKPNHNSATVVNASSADTLAQLIAQVESMKTELSGDWTPESWAARQSLQTLYTRIILQDLEYALDKKIEQDLWNTVFKQPITSLQMRLSDKKNPKRAEVQMNLSNLLEHSSGFYVQLLQEICATFNVDLPCRVSLAINTALHTNANSIVRKEAGAVGARRNLPKRGSCACICQHCLVHLGDLARYRQQVEQARTYYHWAMVVVPTSGHPYNQLAILENQKGNLLSTVFYYGLAMACKTPFPAATTNFEKLLGRIKKEPLPSTARLGQPELTTCFLHYHGDVHLAAGAMDMNRARLAWDRFARQFASQLSPVCHFDWRELVQMVAVQVFALSGAGGTRETTLPETIESLVTSLVSLVECFSHCLIQLQEEKLPRSPLLPALSLLASWLSSNWTTLKVQSTPTVLMTVASVPNFVRLLNSLQKLEAEPDRGKTADNALPPEDNMLQGFQPLLGLLTTSRGANSISEEPLEGSGGADSPVDVYGAENATITEADEKAVFRVRLQRLMGAARSLVRHKVICYQQKQFSLLPQTPQPIEVSAAPPTAGMAAMAVSVGSGGGSAMRANGSPSPARNAVNVAMQSIIQQKQQQQQQQQQSPQALEAKPLPIQQQWSSDTGQSQPPQLLSLQSKLHPPVGAKQSQPGLLISAEIARSIQEHAAQVAKNEASGRTGPSNVNSGPTNNHDGRHTPSGVSAAVVGGSAGGNVVVGGGGVSAAPGGATAGSLAAGVGASGERRYLYNQNREQFQKDLPPRFARKAAAAAMVGGPGSGLLNHENALLAEGGGGGNGSSILSAVQRQPSAEQQPNSLPLARKESEPLFPTPTMWYGPSYFLQPSVPGGTQEDVMGANGGSPGPLHSMGPPAPNRGLMEGEVPGFSPFSSRPGSSAGPGGVGLYPGMLGGPPPPPGPGMSMTPVARNPPILAHPNSTVPPPTTNSHVNVNMFPPPPRFPMHRQQTTQPDPQVHQHQQQQQQSPLHGPPQSSQAQPQQLHSVPASSGGWVSDAGKSHQPPSLMAAPASRPLPPPVGTRMPGPHTSRGPPGHLQGPQRLAPGSGIGGAAGSDGGVDPVSRRLLSGNVQSLWASPLENLIQQQQRQGGMGAGAGTGPPQMRYSGAPPPQSRSGAT